MPPTAEAPSSKRRDRSPNHPALTFSNALDRAHKIWEAEKRHPVNPELAAQHAGYARLNGSSTPALGAMKQYGLMEGMGKDVRITEDAHFIFVHPVGHPDRDARIRKLAMLPGLFSEVLTEFPEGLPSDANLRAKLRAHWKFASDDAANTFIRALREAVALAGPVVDTVGHEDNSGEVIKEPAMPIPSQQPDIPLPPPENLLAPSMGRNNVRVWELGGGATLTVMLSTIKLSKKNVARLEKFVETLKMEASIFWDDDDDDGQETP